jgi:hypothetical protein
MMIMFMALNMIILIFKILIMAYINLCVEMELKHNAQWEIIVLNLVVY